MPIRVRMEKDLFSVMVLYCMSLAMVAVAFVINSDMPIMLLLIILSSAILLLKSDRTMLLMMMLVSIGDLLTLSRNYTTSLYGILLAMFVIKNIKYIRIKSSSFLLYIMLLVYMALGLRIGQDSLFSDVQTILNYLALYLIINNLEIKRTNLYFKTFIYGHLLSTFTAALIMNTHRYSLIIDDNSVQLAGLTLARFTGMQLDPNFFALFCITILAISLYTLANRSLYIKKKFYIRILLIYLMFGVLSLSKMFIVAMFAIIFYFYTSKSDIAFWKKLVSLIAFAIVYILINISLSGELNDLVFGRFINLNRYYGSTINALTTGRYQIWVAYINDWKSSIEKIVFGVGLAQKKLATIGKMHHQTYIELIYQFGIVGSGIYIAYLYSLYRDLKKKVKSSDMVPYGRRIGLVGIIAFLLCGVSLGLFALNVSVYIIAFSFLMLSISRRNFLYGLNRGGY